MNRAGFNRRQVVGGLTAAATLAGSSPLSAANGKRAALPNIVYIMADDLGFADLSCTGSHHIKTPNIDSLAANGLYFRQGYSSTPICSPTRTALLTGCWAQRFPIGVEEPVASALPASAHVPLDRPNIASVMKGMGYFTKLVGKWHLGEPPHNGPLQYGYDEFLGIVEGAADYFRHHMVMGNRELGMGLARDNQSIDANGYLTDIFGDETVRTIEEKQGQPFFISLHFNAPHWPWEGREDAAAAQIIPNSLHYDGGNLAKYKEMVEQMDENVGKVLDALRRTGQLDNTIIVFTSDNGGERFSETWPFIGQKGEVLEGGIRVPLLFQWPDRIAPGTRTEQVMASMDFLPTLLGMAGGNAARAGTFDGMDLSAQIMGGAAAVERTLFFRFNANGQAAVRKGDWKYVKLGGKEHLFNLAEDERERAERSRAEPEIFDELRDLWDEWNAEMLPYRTDSYSDNLKESYPERY